MSDSVIAVGIDESDISRQALAWAAGEALRRSSSLELITTWGLDHADLVPGAVATVQPDTLREAAEAIQQSAVDAVLTDDAYAGLDVQRSIVCAHPADALIEASRHCDLVVVGSHGRGAIGSFLFGSVSRTLIKHSQCPVVVLPPAMTGVGADEAYED